MAASSYLNSAPLIWSFRYGSRRDDVELVEAVPSRCGELLADGLVDFALVPVIEYQRLKNLRLVPEVCVASSEKVRSVVLVSRFNNLKKVRSVALDESSRTSATLVKIIFKEFLDLDPVWTTCSPDIKKMLRESDAALIIGDPGMTFSRDAIHVWDMASLWHSYTGFGFVFAMWAASEKIRVEVPDFTAARDEGLANLDEIVAHYEKLLSLSRQDIFDYLTKNISFELDETMKQGMSLYFELAHKHGLIKEVKSIIFDG